MPTAGVSPPVIVIGICAHGLAIARCLSRAGIQVIGFDAIAGYPGARTNAAAIHLTRDINGQGLVEALIEFARVNPQADRPVLFLTNDRMVAIVCQHAEEIARYFRLSFAHCAPGILPLLRKDHVQTHSLAAGLSIPSSMIIEREEDLTKLASSPDLPLIIKPCRPLSSFKAIVLNERKDLAARQEQIISELPVIAQRFIPGDDRTIRFGALYLRHGEVLARFEGRKLRSRPMGHTTIAISEPDDRIHDITRQFFDGLALSGPVSLELKRDPDGQDWVIEPTVGRTDFWIDLCIHNGVPIPLIEYCHAAGLPIPHSTQTRRITWVNGERDPLVLPWLLFNAPSRFLLSRIRGVYADRHDVRPFVVATSGFLSALTGRLISRVDKSLREASLFR